MDSSTSLARALVAELIESGVGHVIVCPGSRSAPLAYAAYDAAAAGRWQLLVRHDERVAGFTALGIGKARRAPAAVITTSGTAVANLHPAALEAHHAGVPLLVLAADRPGRLRGTWANQTSDLQAEMFGAATRLTVELGAADGVDGWRSAASRAVVAATGDRSARPGPVLLDLGFDEPLVPDDRDEGSALDGSATRPTARPTGADSWTMEIPHSDPPPGLDLGDGRRTVALAGDGANPAARNAAESMGWPLLAEPTSFARGGPHLVGPYRLLLDRDDLGGRIERVVAFGRPTLSRPVTRLLARADVEVVLVRQRPGDPGPGRADLVELGWPELTAAMSAASVARDEPWLESWVRAGQAARRAIDSVLDGWPVLTGPLVGRLVSEALRPDEVLVLAASNPVRDVDLAGVGWPWPANVFANRGLSGIDGTVSTAIGLTLGWGGPGRVLVGDVAAIHDLGALVLGSEEQRPDLTVVVVNDAGGGIFSLLEPGADGERGEVAAARFERLFGTPHAVDFASVCAGLGVQHARVSSAAGLREVLGRAPDGLSVVEVRIDRDDLRPLHDAIDRAVQRALNS